MPISFLNDPVSELGVLDMSFSHENNSTPSLLSHPVRIVDRLRQTPSFFLEKRRTNSLQSTAMKISTGHRSCTVRPSIRPCSESPPVWLWLTTEDKMEVMDIMKNTVKTAASQAGSRCQQGPQTDRLTDRVGRDKSTQTRRYDVPRGSA